MPIITVEVEIFCASCGNGLCNKSSVKNHRSGDAIEVEACEACIEAARDEGYDAGYQDAKKEFELLDEER